MTTDTQPTEMHLPEDISTDESTQETESAEPVVTIESIQKELLEMKDQWLRAMAEMENVRRRTQKDKEDAVKYAVTHFARDVLSFSDNLRRALESCPDKTELSEAVRSLITGVELTEAELLKTLDKHHIKKIDALHMAFDPNYHQAMFEVETDEHPAGTITNVLQIGYTLHDRLLRPALVGISKTVSSEKSDQ